MSDRRRPVSLLLMAASGFAGLGYQIVWTQQGALWLGHEAAAMLAVVAAFFGGLAVGALALGPRIERSAQPLRWYAGCEATIAAWGVVLLALMAPFADRMLALTGAQPTAAWQWTVAFVGTFVLLLPATAAMGATLPAMERVVSSMEGHRPGPGRSIAAYYASNTFGAVLGVLATAFWLVPAIGLAGTSMVCIALNASCAAASLALAPRGSSPQAPAPVASPSAVGAGRRRVVLQLAGTGFLGIGYEVLVVRVLSQVCEDTVYTFAMLLAVYLLGSAAGAATWQRRFARRVGPDGDRPTDRLLCTLAVACLAGTGALYAAETLHAAVLDAAGGGMPAAIGSEALLAVAAFALPTFVMGALFSHLSSRAKVLGVDFGRSLGINIAGAAVAPLVVGVWLAPLLGARAALLLIVVGYLALTTRPAWTRRPAGWPIAWPVALAALVVAAAAPPLAFIDLPPGGRVVSYREGVTAAVSVVEDADGVARLRIDNRQQEGSSATRLVDGRQALLPLLLASAPRRALFLGLGTGVTASTAAGISGLEVDAVELLPEVIAASTRFTRDFDDGAPPRLHVVAADARRYVRTTPLKYDLIVADNFHPARGGSGALYTVEHFEAIRARLVDHGLFCQWLPLHQLDLETLRSIVRSFVVAYPRGWAMLASNSLGTPVVGLVARRDDGRFDLAAVRARLADAHLPDGPAAYGIDDEYALLGSFFAGPESLARFAGDAPANTDDRPVVAYLAPAATYAPRSQPQDRLVELLQATAIRPDELLDGTTAPVEAGRLAAYWSARNRFVDAGRGIRPSSDVRRMLAQVRDPLLDVLRTSPDFRPAYDPLYRMATALARTDAADGRALLAELAAVQPSRPEARQALARMGVGAPDIRGP